MNTTSEDTRKSICEAIAATLRRSGREIPAFRDNDEPIKTYEGFDSQCGIEVTVELEITLGVDDLGNNIFIKEKGKSVRARTLAEIVAAVLVRLKATGECA